MAPLTRLAAVVTAAELPILLVIAPALLFPSPARLTVLVVVPVVWLCARAATGELIPCTPLNTSLWLLAGCVGMSLVATFDMQYSLGKVAGVILGMLLFWAVTRRLTSRNWLRLGVAGFSLAGAVLALLGLLGANVPVLPETIRGIPGARQGFNPNAVSGCLVLFIPLQAVLLSREVRTWLHPASIASTGARWLMAAHGAVLALTTATLLLMWSRGALVGMSVAALAAVMWYGRPRFRLAAAGVASVGVLILPLTLQQAVPSADAAGPGLAHTVAGRVELWSRAVDAIRDAPLTGVGMNAFRVVMPERYPPFLFPISTDLAHAHNHLLQAALDVGLPGLVAYASIWLIIGALLVRILRLSDERVYRSIAGGIGAGLIAHFVFGLTDAIPLGAKVGVLFWLTLALTCSLHRVAVARPTGAGSRA